MRHYILALSLLLSSCQTPVMAQSSVQGIPEDKAIRAILGEAEGESYEGKVALAYALGNRGTLKGVYGYNAIRHDSMGYWRGNRKIDDRSVEDAVLAYKVAKIGFRIEDPTDGATYWENTKAFGKPKWAKNMKVTLVEGAHTFYKEV